MAVEYLPKYLRQKCGDAIIGKKNVMFGKELASTLIGLVTSFDFGDANHTGNPGRKLSRKVGVSDDVLEGTLRVGCEETYCCSGIGIERMWEENFAWSEPFFVDNMSFCSYDQPYWIWRSMIAIF